MAQGRRSANLTKAEECRQSIYSLINSYILKPNEEWQMLLDLIKETVKVCPETFISVVQHSSTPQLSRHKFLLWVITSLLRIVSQTSKSELISGVALCLKNIMMVCKVRDHCTFVYILQEAVELSCDLAKLTHSHNMAQGVLQFPLYMTHFQVSWDDRQVQSLTNTTEEATCGSFSDLNMWLIEVDSLEHISSLAATLMNVLARCPIDLVQVCSMTVNSLFGVVVMLLDFGTLAAKEASLNLVDSFIKACILPQKTIFDHITWCLVASLPMIVKMLVGNENENLLQKFQDKLASCLLAIFCPVEGHPNVPKRFWDHLSYCLHLLLLNGAYPLLNHKMQDCTGQLVMHCLVASPDLILQSFELILSYFGKAEYLQPFVSCLYIALRKEPKVFYTKASEHEKDTNVPGMYLLPYVYNESLQTKKRKTETLGKKVLLQRAPLLNKGIPPMALMLVKKVMECAKASRTCCQFQLICLLEGIRCGLEVFARLTNSHRGKSVSFVWTHDQLKELCRSWELAAQVASNFPQESSDQILCKIIESIGALAVTAVLHPLSPAILDQVMMLSTLPMSKTEISGGNFEGLMAGSSLTKQQYQELKTTLSQNCKLAKCRSLSTLAILPIQAQGIQAIKQALGSSDFDVQAAAIMCLPLVLCSLELSPAELLNECKLESRDLQLMFVRQIPSLLLSGSDNKLERCYGGDNFKDPVISTCTLKMPSLNSSCSIKSSVLDMISKVPVNMNDSEVVVALVESYACIAPFAVQSSISMKCLPLVTHTNAQICHAISAHVRLLFTKKDSTEQIQEDKHTVFTKLNEAFLSGARGGDIKKQELTVNIYGQIGRIVEGSALSTCIIALLKFIFERSLTVRAAACSQLQNIAAVRQLSLAKLLSQHKMPVSQFIMKFIHVNYIKKISVFKKVSGAFGFKEMRGLFDIVRDVLIPMLVCQASSEASITLNIIAKELKTNEQLLLLESFKHIFLYLVRDGQQQDLTVAADFIKSVGGFEMADLMHSDTKNVLNLLLLHLSTHRDRILTGVRMLAKMSASKVTLGEADVDGFIADFLEPHLHGIVAFFNFMLVRSDFFESSAKGKLAIGSLIELMKLMGARRITHVKMKIIAMLRHCLTFKNVEVTELTLSAWKQFIHCVDLESLGPLLGQIVVALYPVIDEQPHKVADIFHFLIVQNRAVLAPYFNEIYLMPESSVLADVTNVLKKHLEGPRSLREQFRHLLKGVQHERPDVRLHALKALHKLLKSNRGKLENYMVDSDTVDPVITEIVTTIFRSLRGAGIELREVCGKCLGELGAIDPGKLDIPITSPTRVVKCYEVDGDFAVDLFGELARAYLAAINTRSQDCCAFAIQELLSIFDCANSDEDSEGARVWSELQDDTQEVLRPHFNSTYTATVPKLGKYKSPVFGSTKNLPFHDWLQKWCSILIHKLDDCLAKRVFLPCSLIFQHDRAIALYLLPHVLTSLLRCGNSNAVVEIRTEVMAILNHSAQNKEHADASNMCAQTVFTVIDHLTAWADGKAKAAAVRRVKGVPQKGNPEEIKLVTSFLEGIPKDILAQAAFRCQAYTRSLMYLELYLREKPAEFQKNVGFLQKIYVELDDSDGVAGSAAVNTVDPTLAERILQYEISGNYRDAAACYERAIQEDPNELTHHEGLLRSMMCQGEFTSALMHVDGLLAKRPDWLSKINLHRVEASWKLGQWNELEKYLKAESTGSKNWDVNLGQLLLAAKQKDFNTFNAKIRKLYSEQMGPLCAASLEQGSYQRGYDYIVRLHMLQELEDGVKHLLVPIDSCSGKREVLLGTWPARSQLIQESFRNQEPILSLRRVILGLASNLDKEIGKCWLESARTARKAGHLQVALSLLLNAKDHDLPEFCVEWAEHQRAQGSSHEALLSLQKAVSQKWTAVPASIDDNLGTVPRNRTHADALLLISQWMEDTAHYDTQTILKQYKCVITVQPDSEDGHFYLGRYYDRLKSVLASDRLTKSAEFLQFIIRHYGHALEYGSKYIYQCMPRMLSLWLDFGSTVPDGANKSQEKESKALKMATSQLNELMKLMKTLTDRLPPYQFLIAFSQLISRICHPNSDVFTQLEAIILKLLEHFPQQSLWMMIAVSKSTHSDRERRCKRILDKAKHDLPHIGKLIDDMIKLSDRLLEVCNKHVEPSKNCSMDKLCRGLARLTSSSDFSSIMVPLQASMIVTLPTRHGHYPDHQPFPGVSPSIVRFDDKVEVLPSLQRPKKVAVLASDGHTYNLLCKPKDDLRKDARLMEFNTLVNKCLRKDRDSRQRRLYIRTYAVVPLNEECGLLEWVHNTQGFRNILLKLYQEKGQYVSGRELKDLARTAGNDTIRRKEVFQTQLLPRHPPVFGEWFLRTFPDPTSWFSSRLAYAHTIAVMSMVGYILGLGDRHGENILFDSTNGDCVHVDFNCLFNRGETFDVPEVVPFRLTQNMTHGLGVTGYEGAFRKSCEATMKVLRQDSDALICVLKTFIHDPLVEWEKVKGRPASAEATNEKAMKIMKDIEDRLQGKYQKSKGLPLSIEGHVHALIEEATSIDNLCRMYIGWAPYL